MHLCHSRLACTVSNQKRIQGGYTEHRHDINCSKAGLAHGFGVERGLAH